MKDLEWKPLKLVEGGKYHIWNGHAKHVDDVWFEGVLRKIDIELHKPTKYIFSNGRAGWIVIDEGELYNYSDKLALHDTKVYGIFPVTGTETKKTNKNLKK